MTLFKKIQSNGRPQAGDINKKLQTTEIQRMNSPRDMHVADSPKIISG